MDLAPDFDEFCGLLNAHAVEFVIVGAYALAFHGAPRFTGDFDIFVRPTTENGERLIRAISAFGFPTDAFSAEDIAVGRKDDRSYWRVDMNRVVHFEIPAEDLERAKKFYRENFGWKLNQLGPEVGNYVLVQTGPTDDKGMPQDKAFINGGLMPRDPSASSPVLVIAVDDADASVAKIEKSGGQLVGEIMDIPNVGRYARVQDTEGNVIGVIKPVMP